MAEPEPFRFGLIEFAPFTALLGSDMLESIVLGNRGGPGLAWAALSSYNALHIVRICIIAALPPGIRQLAGLSRPQCDAALGRSFDLDRADFGPDKDVDAKGISCVSHKVSTTSQYRCLTLLSSSRK